MLMDLDTVLVALYTIVDDLYQQHVAGAKPVRPGPRPTVSDSEVLTLALCGQWGGRSERAFLRYVRPYWRGYFPRLLSQSAYNRRCRDLAGVLVALVPVVARELRAAGAAYEVIDTVAVPVVRRCRGCRRRRLGEIAALGWGGSDKDWYYGCKLLLAVLPTGGVTGFVLAPASTEDRWLAEALLGGRAAPQARPRQRQDLLRPTRPNGTPYVGPTGPRWPQAGAGPPSTGPYLADKGFEGTQWQAHWDQDYGAPVLTPPKGRRAKRARRQHGRWRQIIETSNGQLTDTLGLHFPRARTPHGFLTRIAAKLAAVKLGLWLNHLFNRPPLALATLFPAY